MEQYIDTNPLNDISVAVVDDHEVVLEGYRSYLLRLGVACVETFTSATALLNRIQARKFSVFIVFPLSSTASDSNSQRQISSSSPFMMRCGLSGGWQKRRWME